MDQKGLIFNNRDEFLRIDVKRIVYFEAAGNYTYIFTTDGQKVLVCQNLAQMQDSLSRFFRETKHYFVRIGRKHVVNLNYIFRISLPKKMLVLTDFEKFQYKLDVSETALKELKQRMLELKK